MRKYLLICLICCLGLPAMAKHITGGEIIYDYMGPGADPNTRSYTITLRLFRDENCFNCATMPTDVTLGIYNNDNNQRYGGYRNVPMSSTSTLPLNALPNCITNPPTLNYQAGYYSFTIDLPDNASGYTVTYQTCCRIDGIMNIPNQVGATYVSMIPGKNFLGTTKNDSSPRFALGISVVCYNKPFTLDFSATDPDPTDSLVYTLCGAYDGGGANNASYNTPSPPPYTIVGYTNGYNGTSPLGPLASINSQTGIISGIAPDAGKYVVSVCVSSYRDGQYIATHRKDFIITVAPCDFAGAQLKPSYTSCDGFTVNFENLNNSPLNLDWYWEFGDGQTSTDETPSHTYADTGVYRLKLVVNRNGGCSDSAYAWVNVFPGYFPDFSSNSPSCKNVPISFNDRTTATYGVVNAWSWDFGVNSILNDTSHVRNPTFTYTESGTYQATLIVSSSKGCIDTVKKDITILDKAPVTVTNDTLICVIDTLRISAIGTTNNPLITWSPNYMISDIHSATPLVSPDITTTYYLDYADRFGCSTRDSVKVSVVTDATLSLMGDSTICLTDPVTLSTQSNALYFTWTPSFTLSDPSIREPVATPTAVQTAYHVKASISNKCFKEDDVVISTVPYPIPYAGKDTTICFTTNAFLHATGGTIYDWSPVSFLSDTHSPSPIAIRPRQDIAYVVAVRDTKGCPKPSYDTVIVHVTRIIANAGPRDTSIVLEQPLQLEATGSLHYEWSPEKWLSDPNIYNPVANPLDNIEYVLRASDDNGCFGTDTILVKVFKVEPGLYVPDAFTPTGDGLNDVFRPIPIGMKSLKSFMVYNRWGQLLFSTTQMGKGWDGKFQGNPQPAGTYVWYAEGVDYLNRIRSKKGSVILIR